MEQTCKSGHTSGRRFIRPDDNKHCYGIINVNNRRFSFLLLNSPVHLSHRQMHYSEHVFLLFNKLWDKSRQLSLVTISMHLCTEPGPFLFDLHTHTYSQVSLQHVHQKAINSPTISQMPGQTTKEPCGSEQIIFPMLFNVLIGQHEHLIAQDHITIISQSNHSYCHNSMQKISDVTRALLNKQNDTFSCTGTAYLPPLVSKYICLSATQKNSHF